MIGGTMSEQQVLPPPYRYLTSEEAELLPLPLQLERLREINEELVRTHNHMVIQGAKEDRESAALRASLAQSEAERERLQGELSHYPAKWREDSSLATWFPFTAEELARTRNKLQELQLRYVMVDSELPTDFEPELEAEARIMAFAIAHHRLVIELARERELRQGLRQVVKEYRENPSRVHHSSTCKKGVNYPGLGLCDDRCLICRWADSLLEDKAKPVATNAGEESDAKTNSNNSNA
jgi:hypothetical protein